MDISIQKLFNSIAVNINGVDIPFVTDYKIESSAPDGTELTIKIKIPTGVSYQAMSLSAKKATYRRQRRTARNNAP